MLTHPSGRRAVLRAGAAAAGFAAAGLPLLPRAAQAAGTLNLVLESEVVILDPHATTAAITRTFGYFVWDTLFAMAENGAIRPQMVREHSVSADGLQWRFTLRDGLRFHDGAPVTAADCVASLRRWMPRDPLGRMLQASLASLEAGDPTGFTLTLKQPFPLLLDVLGKPNAPVPFMMPARIVEAAGSARITEIIGSGPFKFRPDLWRAGASMTLDRNPDYVPRDEAPDFLAGGKRVKIDRAVLRVISDDATSANALTAGEVDYVQYLGFDHLASLEKARGVELMGLTGIHMFQGNFRLNHASGPFADPAIRQVMWHLVDQAAILQAIGIPARFARADCPSFWMCDAPLESRAGSEPARYDVAAAREMLKRTAYKGEPIVFLEVSGSISQTAANVLAQSMKEAGFNVDEQVMDWGTVLARRGNKEGWSLFPVYSNGVDMVSPLNHFYIASTCADYPGWSCDNRIPPLLQQFAATGTPEERRRVADDIQRIAYELVPSLMWGQFSRPAGYRDRMKGLIRSSFPIFWEVSV
ncbi:ABC transporter substrate-binding protein [Pseudoroseomonas globiformis]|uniref:ABC transporter substrate-binding protein n=1 Tax=Teichococcus globiformis TaxID=2307229 RepID=A0ABV7G879_9PROT